MRRNDARPLMESRRLRLYDMEGDCASLCASFVGFFHHKGHEEYTKITKAPKAAVGGERKVEEAETA